MRFLILASLCCTSLGATTYTCASGNWPPVGSPPLASQTGNGATGDFLLTGTDSYTFSGSCKLQMNGYGFLAPDGTFSGTFSIGTGVTVLDCGRPGKLATGNSVMVDYHVDCFNGTIISGGNFSIVGATFSRSSGFATTSTGSANVTFQNNNPLCAADSVIPLSINRYSGDYIQYCVRTNSTSSGTRLIDNNVILAGWVDNGGYSSGTNASGWTITNNKVVGPRAGIFCGPSSQCHDNYSHMDLTTTPHQPYWVENWNFTCGVGANCYNNIIRAGHWVLRYVKGSLHDNIIMEMDGIDYIQGLGDAGDIVGNIFVGYLQSSNRYSETTCYNPQDGGIVQTNAADSFKLQNNTFDLRWPCSAHVAFGIGAGTIAREVTANAFITSNANTYAAISVRPQTEAAPTLPYPTRIATRADYNAFNGFSVNYQIGVITGAPAECSGAWASHDRGACPNGQVTIASMFNGVDGAGTLPIGFPYTDAEILAGTKTIQNILDFFHYAYSPKTGGELENHGDTTDYPTFANIGAVQTRPAITLANHAPVVTAGPNFFINGLTATLAGVAYDDGLGSPNGTLTCTWTTTIQPAGSTATFARLTANIASFANTAGISNVTVTKYGTYTFQDSCTDGSLTTNATASVIFVLPHPRIALNDGFTLQRIQAKMANNDVDWTNLKSGPQSGNNQFTLDQYLAAVIPPNTISGCTNANPTVCTLPSAPPIGNGSSLPSNYCFIGGVTGVWSTLNTATSYPGHTCTRIGSTNTISIDYDGTGKGTFPAAGGVIFFRINTGTTAGVSFIGYDFQGGDTYRALIRLSLGYQGAVTTNATLANSYADQVINIFRYYNKITSAGIFAPIAIDTSYPTRFLIQGFALAFDCVRPRMAALATTAGFDTDIGNTMSTMQMWENYANVHRSLASGAQYGNDAGLNGNLDQPTSNYWMGHFAGLGQASYAIGGDASQPTGDFGNSLTTMIDPYSFWSYWNTQSAKIVSAFATPTDGAQLPIGMYHSGMPPESWSYGVNSILNMCKYFNAKKTATNGVEDLVGTYCKPSVAATIHALQPNGWCTTRGGDWAGSEGCDLNRGYVITMAGLLRGTTEGAWMQHLATTMASVTYPTGVINPIPTAEDRFLWGQCTYAGNSCSYTNTDYTATEPLYWYGQGDEHHFWRSDWTTSATWFEFWGQLQDEPNHAARWQGSIDMTRGNDPLIISAGQWYDNNGTVGNPYNFTDDTSYGSTLFVDDGATYCIVAGSTPSAYEGCGMYWGVYTTPPFPDKQTSTYMHAISDVTRNYDKSGAHASRTLKYWYREVALFSPGTVIVFDRILQTAGTYPGVAFPKRLRFHLNPSAVPTLSSNVARSVIGSSSISVAPILPATASVALSQLPDAQGDATRSTLSSTFTQLAEVTDSAQTAGANFATVLYATSNVATLPASTALATIDANFTGIQVADTTCAVAIFATPISGPVSDVYTLNSYTTTSFTTTCAGTQNIMVVGLTPGSGYSVTGGPCTVNCTSVTVGSDRVLYFTASGPASFIVGQALTCTITTGSPLATGTVNATYSVTLAVASCAGPPTWSLAAGSLPTGLSLGTSSGTISGVPSAAGTFNFTIQANDGVNTPQKAFTTLINAQLVITSTSPLSAGTVSVNYSVALASTGGTAPLVWSLLSGTLPNGLSLSSGGVISGKPTVAGTFNFTIQLADNVGATASKAFTIVVASACAITTLVVPNGTVGVAYTTTLATSNCTAPLVWSISVGTLPAGLMIHSATGVIDGTPTTQGSSSFTALVTDNTSATDIQALTLTIGVGGQGATMNGPATLKGATVKPQ